MKKQQILHVRSDTFCFNDFLNQIFCKESVLEKRIAEGWIIAFVVPVLSNGSTLGYTYILEKEEE
jgi:hypothetical protein